MDTLDIAPIEPKTAAGRARLAKVRDLERRGVDVPRAVRVDIDRDVPGNDVTSWLWYAHLWDRPTSYGWNGPAWALSNAQEQWDRSRPYVTGALERQREREHQAADRQRERDAADTARREQEAEELKAELRARYLAMPGTTETSFEQDLPELLRDHRRREMERTSDAVEDAMRDAVWQAIGS